MRTGGNPYWPARAREKRLPPPSATGRANPPERKALSLAQRLLNPRVGAMGGLDHYAEVVRQVGAAGAARALWRRANRVAQQAFYRGREEWTGQRLLAAWGVGAHEAVDPLLGPLPGEVWCASARREALRAALSRCPAVKARAVARANAAVARQFDVFGQVVSFGARAPIDWHRDPVSGHVYPLVPAERLRLSEAGADPKVPWVLGRLDAAVALGQGAVCAGEADRATYARSFVALVRDFIVGNPVGRGVQWASPMEVALRAANLAQALHLFSDAPEVREPDFLLAVVASLANHGDWVVAHLEDRGAVPNNHLLANFVGLLAIAALVPSLPQAARWSALARAGLAREVVAQVHPDGASFEGSVPYHRLALELLLLGELFARAEGASFGGVYVDKLERMFEVAAATLFPNGQVPQLGDNDSGRALALTDRASLDHGYLPELGAAMFGNARLKRRDAALPDEAIWLFAEDGRRRFERLAPAAVSASFSSPEGGWHVLAGPALQAAISAGPRGQRGVGGHNHNDALSFELWIDGCTVIVDPGTGGYLRDAKVRDAFRSTAAHNTLQVDEQELSPIDPSRPFALPDRARCQVTRFETDATHARLTARHHGFSSRGVIVERTFVLDRLHRALAVVDRLEGTRVHSLRLPLHLPDAQVRLRPVRAAELVRARAVKGAPSSLGPIAAELGPPPGHAVVVFSQGLELAVRPSAYSPGYGRIQPAACVEAKAIGHAPASVGFVVLGRGG